MSTMTISTNDLTPRVWIGCLACYNAGRLVGEWYPAADADAVSIDALHIDSGTLARVSCEELWVMDHEHLPISGECSPSEAAEWGRILDDVDAWQRDALMAWVRSGDYVMEGHGPLPSLPDFEERYCGDFASFGEYASALADDIALLDGVPEEIARYFDWDSWTRDLAFDFTTESAIGGGVYVFRSL